MSRSQDPLTIEYLLLGLIREKPTHAYDLYKQLTGDEALKSLWTFHQSRLYAVLEKIEKNGFIQSQADPEGGLPVRKICTLTPEGRLAFEAWLHSPTEHTNELRSDFMAKLYFMTDRPKDERDALIREQLIDCERKRSRLQKKMEKHTGTYLGILLNYRLETLEAAIRWMYALLASEEN